MKQPFTSPVIQSARLLVLIGLLGVLTPIASKGSEAELKRLLESQQTLYQQGKYAEAITASEKILELTTRLRGSNHIDTSASLNNLALLYQNQGRYEDAEPLYLRSLEIRKKQSVASHPSTANASNNLGGLYWIQGRYDEAERLFRNSLDIYEKHMGVNHPDYARVLFNIALLRASQGDYKEAEPLYRRCLEIREKKLGEDHPDTAATLDSFAGMYREQGRYVEAEPLYRRGLEIREKQLGADHPDTASSLNNLAAMYQNQGRYGEAEILYRRSRDIYEKQLGSNHPHLGTALHNLAELYQEQGHYAEAEPLYRRALEIRETQLGADHPETADTLNSLAGVYQVQGRYEEAEPLFLRSLEIRENQLGADHPDTATSLYSLAGLYSDQDRDGEALPLFRRSLEIRERQLGTDHRDTADTLNSLAILHWSQGRFDEAELLYRRSLTIRERQLGVDHPDTAACLNNLALLYRDQGRYGEAEPLFYRNLEVCEKQLGMDHPNTAHSLNNLASLYQAQGHYEKAQPLVERGISSTAAHWRRMLAYFSERESLAFQRSESPFDIPGKQGSGGLAAEAQLLFKGAVVESMNSRRIVDDQLARTEQGRELLQQREALRPRYHQIVLAKGGESDEAKSLQTQLEDLDKKAVALIGSDGGFINYLFVGLEHVQKSLPAATRLVETFRYDHNVDPMNWELRYASTIISSSGEPVFLSHGDAESIEGAIQIYRASLDGKSMEHSIEIFKEAEATLYTRILVPLEEHLTPGQTVIFSPDAQLHFLPLGMLRCADGKAFGEKYQVRYVSSGRDLVKEVPLRRATGLKAFVLGNPDYRDNAPLGSLAEAEEATQRDEDKTAIANNLRSGMSQDSGSIQFRPLPGTAREIGSLSIALKENGYQVTTLSGKEATEETVKESMAGHDVIHLATHGFFLNEIKIGQEEPERLMGEDRPKGLVQNPMFRSGLALAGAQSTFNLWKSGQVPPPSRDGVLLAAEITGVDLRGTDLVVLSACETAAGESLDGEGVIGLRRAFNAAGVQNLVMTLWPVNDEATVEVMEVFYQKYLSGTPAPEALAETQRELLPKWIEAHGAAEALARLAPFICTSLGSAE